MKVLSIVVVFVCALLLMDAIECRRPRRKRRRQKLKMVLLRTTPEMTTQRLTTTEAPPITSHPLIADKACHRVCGGGSYLDINYCACVCRQEGFEYNPEKARCEDINECENQALCNGGECVNEKGSYQCHCSSDYILHANRKACLPVPKVVPCGGLYCGGESSLDETRCYCTCTRRGFTYDYFKETCVDIDECTEGLAVCPSGCTNTIGGYRCDCGQEFRLGLNARSCRSSGTESDCKDKASFCRLMATTVDCFFNTNIRNMCKKTCRVCVG